MSDTLEPRIESTSFYDDEEPDSNLRSKDQLKDEIEKLKKELDM
ncbi:hypothetical protein [Candidatus Lokiarchaeum ossiferum]